MLSQPSLSQPSKLLIYRWSGALDPALHSLYLAGLLPLLVFLPGNYLSLIFIDLVICFIDVFTCLLCCCIIVLFVHYYVLCGPAKHLSSCSYAYDAKGSEGLPLARAPRREIRHVNEQLPDHPNP